MAVGAPGRHGSPVIIAGHLNLEGITAGSETTKMPRGREVYWPLDAIRECFPDALVLGGHYHERQLYQGVQIIGSLARLTFGEEDTQPAFIEVEV